MRSKDLDNFAQCPLPDVSFQECPRYMLEQIKWIFDESSHVYIRHMLNRLDKAILRVPTTNEPAHEIMVLIT